MAIRINTTATPETIYGKPLNVIMEEREFSFELGACPIEGEGEVPGLGKALALGLAVGEDSRGK